MKSRWTLVVLIGLLALSSGLSFAVTTSRLRVSVEDHQGNALQGATVLIESAALIGGPQSGTTDATGEVTFNLLPQGSFTVKASFEGFEAAETTASVRLDRTAAVVFRLAPTAFEGEIEVGATVPVIDLTQTDMSQVFDLRYLRRAAVGMDGRSYMNIIAQAPGTVQGFRPRITGSSTSENAFLIDGINSTDPSTGVDSMFVTLDAIQEINVLTSAFDAEYSHVTGGVANLVTKSGGNRFTGTLDARYRSEALNEPGDHYDPDDDVSSRRLVSLTLGGPILRDRLWFFTAFEYDQMKTTPTGALAARERTSQNIAANVTWSPSSRHRLSARYLTAPIKVDNAWISSTVLPEATTHQDWSGPIVQVDLNSSLSDSLLLTVAGGTYRNDVVFRPQSGDLDTPSAYDVDTPLSFSNGWYGEFSERNRTQLRGVLTAFAGDLAGSHELKVGGDYQSSLTEETTFRPGGYEIRYYNNDWSDEPWPDGDGDGLVDYLLYRDYPADRASQFLRSTVEGFGAFIQDEWRPLPSLTVSAGLRYDSMAHTNTVGDTIADFRKWQPRFGIAWDIGEKGKHVLRASWGRFSHPGVTNFGANVSGVVRGTVQYVGLDYWCNVGICDRATARSVFGDDSEFIHLDSDGDEHPFYLWRLYTNPAETVDTLGVGRLRMPFQDQTLLAFETQVYRETAIELSYLDAKYGDLIEDTCINNTWAWGDGDLPSIDDPSTWTDEGDCTASVRANMPGLGRTYRAWILRLESRARAWLHLIASYTYSKNRGNVHNSDPFRGFGSRGSGLGYEFDRFPTNFLNTDGNLADDHRHNLKLNGFVLLPYDLAVGFGAFYRSAPPLHVFTLCSYMANPSESGLEELARLGIDYGQAAAFCQSPFSGQLVLEPAGSRRAGDLWQLDLELSKGFTIGGTSLRAIVTVLNAFSGEAPTSWTQNPFDTRGWGTPIEYQQPRRFELGFRVEF